MFNHESHEQTLRDAGISGSEKWNKLANQEQDIEKKVMYYSQQLRENEKVSFSEFYRYKQPDYNAYCGRSDALLNFGNYDLAIEDA